MPARGELPPKKKHKDLPPWRDDLDNVKRRAADAAWAALFKKDWADVTFKDLAKEVGVTTPALYHYYPTLQHVALTVAQASLSKLRGGVVTACNTAVEKKKSPRVILRETVCAYWDYARKRPRHFAMAFSPDFNADKEVIERRESLRRCIEDTIAIVTENESNRPKGLELWALVHGGASIIAMGKELSEGHLMDFIAHHVVVLDGAPRHS